LSWKPEKNEQRRFKIRFRIHCNFVHFFHSISYSFICVCELFLSCFCPSFCSLSDDECINTNHLFFNVDLSFDFLLIYSYVRKARYGLAYSPVAIIRLLSSYQSNIVWILTIFSLLLLVFLSPILFRFICIHLYELDSFDRCRWRRKIMTLVGTSFMQFALIITPLQAT
jgi:hypothetical protein